MLVGLVLKRSVFGTVIVIPLLMAGIAVSLVVFGHGLIATAVLLGAWGFIGTPAPVGWGTWLSRTLPADAEAGGGLMVATIQFAITLGAATGGFLFDAQGYQATFGLSAVLLVAAAALAFAASRVASTSPATPNQRKSGL
jgi:predicted MFS family arabinose efflux permease